MDSPQIPFFQQWLTATLQILALFAPAMTTEDLLTARISLSEAHLFVAHTIIDRESAATGKSNIPSCPHILILDHSLTTP